nr:putative capsid protein [Crucivirus sp.]
MSNYQKYSLKQRKAWGAKMAAARAAKQGASYSGRGAYYRKDKATGQMVRQKKSAVRARVNRKAGGGSGYAGIGSALGGALGTAIGGPAGTALGSVLGGLGGNLLGEGVKYFTGKGDYEVINNAFLQGDNNSMVPIHNPDRRTGDVFRRVEYLGDIISHGTANTFKIQSFPVNPGLESTFEWLSQIACNYEEYEFEGLYFEFRSMSADALNSTNTALGQVIMAANYNASSANFTNKAQMENYEGGVSGKPSCSIRYFVECAKQKTVLSTGQYIRQGAIPTGQDARLYDLCNFQIATNGLQGTKVNLGELWVSYQVVLRKPKMFAALGQYGAFAAGNPTLGAYTNALPLGSGSSWDVSVSNTILGFTVTGTRVSWYAPTINQAYMFYVVWTGTQVATVVAPSLSAINTSGMVVTGTTNFTSKTATDSATICSYQGFLAYTASSWNGAVDSSNRPFTGIDFGTAGTLPSAGTAVSYWFVQIPNSYASL